MSAPAEAVRVIQSFEGCHRKRADGQVEAYADPAHGWKLPTIGWGSTGPDVTRGAIWSQAQCDARLQADADRFSNGLARLSPVLAIEERRRAALVSWAYNLGLGNYSASTLRRKVNERDWPAAAEQCMKWVRAAGVVLPGLVRRRAVESEMLRRG